MNSEATCLGGYLGRRIFGKGIGASDKSSGVVQDERPCTETNVHYACTVHVHVHSECV